MTLTLFTPVTDLKGVGPRKADALKRLGIETVDDLLHHYPSGYSFAPPIVPLDQVKQDGQAATTMGIVVNIHEERYGTTSNFRVTLADNRRHQIQIIWFYGGYLRDRIFKGSRLMVSGPTTTSGNYEFINPQYKVLKPGEVPNPADLNTVTYPMASGITSKDIGRLVEQCLSRLGDAFPRSQSIYSIHRPSCQADVDDCRRALKRDELFYMQLGLAVRRQQRKQVRANVQCRYSGLSLLDYFPFQFTNDQWKVIREILADLCKPRPMNRLLQGDVGCGKTAVAAYAAMVVAMNRGQTAILCPTEILAQQHYETIRGYFERAGITCQLVTGNTSKAFQVEYTSSIIIGTTALLTQYIAFRNLGLVIIDEQHKFGVEQRAALKRHGNPHVLTMTATPIPRTIAMTVFGDLDISTIREMPPGREPVITLRALAIDAPILLTLGPITAQELIIEELSKGHQVYVVCPRIEALDDEMRAVEEVWQEYRQIFPNASVAYLHGQMTPEQKQQVAEWWAGPSAYGRILVSTTVVEVGVDNSNATIMVIEGAERFGLAQLHQLRGRVGRGEHQSYCFLLSDTESAEARSRLRIMEQTNDGFEIAEHDLKMRGPGDLLSTRQHGLPDLKLADLVEDYDLLIQARDDAGKFVAEDLGLVKHPEIRAELDKRFGGKLNLGDTA